jgi:hypothetical protein
MTRSSTTAALAARPPAAGRQGPRSRGNAARGPRATPAVTGTRCTRAGKRSWSAGSMRRLLGLPNRRRALFGASSSTPPRRRNAERLWQSCYGTTLIAEMLGAVVEQQRRMCSHLVDADSRHVRFASPELFCPGCPKPGERAGGWLGHRGPSIVGGGCRSLRSRTWGTIAAKSDALPAAEADALWVRFGSLGRLHACCPAA